MSGTTGANMKTIITPTHVAPFSVRSGRFWAAYLVQMRPYLLFVSGFTGLSGLAFAPEVPTMRLLVLTPAFFATYGFGQALTDCFQTDTDAISSPYRPLVQGMLRRGDVLAVSLVGLAACGAVFAASNLAVVPLVTACVFGLATYTWFKRRWWAGPLYNAWIVAGLYAVALLSGGGTFGRDLLSIGDALAALAAVFFGYANFVVAGYFKDVEADRATGYDTVVVHFGRRAAALVSHVLSAAALAAAAVVVLPRAVGPAGPASLGFLLAGAGASLVAQLRLHRVHEDAEAHRAIVPVVHAYLLVLAALVASAEPAWIWFCLAAYAAFVRAVSRRTEITQI